jgi:hypothetical protein
MRRFDPDRPGRLEAEPRVVLGMTEQAEQRLPSAHGESDHRVHQRRADALVLAIGPHRHRADQPDRSGGAILPDELALAEQQMTADAPIIRLRHEGTAPDPASVPRSLSTMRPSAGPPKAAALRARTGVQVAGAL